MVAWRQVEEEAVLLNVDTSEYYSLNPVAAEIWEKLEKGETLRKTVKFLAASYGEPSEKIARDAREFLSDLLREGLILTANSK